MQVTEGEKTKELTAECVAFAQRLCAFQSVTLLTDVKRETQVLSTITLIFILITKGLIEGD